MPYGTALAGILGSGGGKNLVTTLYTGTGAARSLVTGQNLAAGALTWIRDRSTERDHALYDTVRGALQVIESNTTRAQATDANGLSAFNSNGFSIGNSANINTSGRNYVAWSFLKKAGFMDIVGWEGTNQQALTVNHGLNAETGMIIGKRTDASGGFYVYHRGLGATKHLLLNSSAGEVTSVTPWANSTPTSTSFDVWLSGSSDGLQGLGRSFIGYVFAHNPAEKIFCGSFTTDGSGNATVTIGFAPNWLMLKSTTTTQNWLIFDTTRGWSNSSVKILFPNGTNVEVDTNNYGDPTSDGFTFKSAANLPYIYMAIG